MGSTILFDPLKSYCAEWKKIYPEYKRPVWPQLWSFSKSWSDILPIISWGNVFSLIWILFDLALTSENNCDICNQILLDFVFLIFDTLINFKLILLSYLLQKVCFWNEPWFCWLIPISDKVISITLDSSHEVRDKSLHYRA